MKKLYFTPFLFLLIILLFNCPEIPEIVDTNTTDQSVFFGTWGYKEDYSGAGYPTLDDAWLAVDATNDASRLNSDQSLQDGRWEPPNYIIETDKFTEGSWILNENRLTLYYKLTSDGNFYFSTYQVTFYENETKCVFLLKSSNNPYAQPYIDILKTYCIKR